MLKILKEERTYWLNIIQNSKNKLGLRTAVLNLGRTNRLIRKFNSLTKS
jgi:hypothetical protein